MTALGDCNYKLTSKSCAHNAFCPLPNPQNLSLCQPCAELLPGFYCNCEANLRLNCAACNGVNCVKCIPGYVLQNEQCVLENFCEDGPETCSHGYFCPVGIGQRSCLICDSISSDKDCHCAGLSLNACKTCLGAACTSCLDTYQLVDGECYKQADFGPCTTSMDCQFGTFCKEEKCISCSGISTVEHCNCGELFSACQVCGKDNTCLECAGGLGFTKGPSSDGIQFPNSGCKNRGNCGNGSSYNCGVNFYCRWDQRICLPCDTKIISEYGCNCGRNQQIFNCQTCDTVSKQAKLCFPGYKLENRAVVGYTCYPNFCDKIDNFCQTGYYCPANPIGTTDCLTCTETSPLPCTCFYQENCQMCDASTKKCVSCLKGFLKNIDGACVPKTNICGKMNTSLTCDNEHVCQGTTGDDCVPCKELQKGQHCNCLKEKADNCLECDGKLCQKCREEFILEEGKCVPNMCGDPINTMNCYVGYYCPNAGSVGDTVCLACDKQQQNCNCGLLSGCQTCGTAPNTCETCFNGFQKDPISSKCELKQNICDYSNGSTGCRSGKFCNGKFGDECISCATLTKGKFCKCNSNLIQNCVECDLDQCKTCLTGYFPVNGQCHQNTCFSGSPSQTCAFGNYCPPGDGSDVVCEICDGKNTISCQCGANNCITCGSQYNSCDTCVFGYTLDASSQCVLKKNICDSNDSSSLCQAGFFCNSTFGNPCVTCASIQQNQVCNCAQNFIANCVQCAGNKCFMCLQGYLVLPEGTCVPNSCDSALSSSTCYSGNQCNPGSNPGDNCLECSPEIESQCSCGNALNCKTCGPLLNTCQTCLIGNTFNTKTLQCDKITSDTKNICDITNTSSRCESQFFCAGTYGDTCQFCSTLTAGYSCNCSSTLQENCVFCENQECKFCIPGYYLKEGKCIVNKCGPNIPEPCVDNFYCPETPTETLCEQCSIQSIQCNCGTANHCQVCSQFKNQCKTCIKGYMLRGSECVEALDCVFASDCGLGEFCFESKCGTCAIQSVACNCGIAENCKLCGPSGTCKSCLGGWGPNLNSSCVVPICVQKVPLGQFCEGPDTTAECPVADEGQMQTSCNCGEAKNCANCVVGNAACGACRKGSVMINGVCFIETPGFTGNCEQAGNSIFCMPGNACIAPEVCTSCEGVSAGFSCNCNANLILNCTKCEGDKCAKCFRGFILVEGECVPACYSNSMCGVGELCDLVVSICAKCDGKDICNCGEHKNCTDCDIEKCFTCVEGYKVGLSGDCDECAEGWIVSEETGLCVVGEDAGNKTLNIVNAVGIAVGVVSVVGMIVGIAVFYAKRPKRLSMQHNLIAGQK